MHRALRLALAAAFLAGATTAFAATALEEYNAKDVSTILNDYKPANVVETAGDYKLGKDGGANARVMDLVTRLTQIGALLAIAGIVYSGFLMVSSTGNDEKASAGKKGLIWSSVGFAAMILAGPAVNAVINLAYGTYK